MQDTSHSAKVWFGRHVKARAPRKGFLKTLGLMILMGIVTWWVVIEARPLFLRLGISEHAADRLPIAGFFLGMGLGLAMMLSASVKEFFQGLGGALMEEFTYSETGDPLAVTFADYLMPAVREMPPLEIILTEDYPSPLNPLGIKGAGESGVNAVGAAIASAIDDAIGIPGAITQLPVTPQRLKAIIDGKR